MKRRFLRRAGALLACLLLASCSIESASTSDDGYANPPSAPAAARPSRSPVVADAGAPSPATTTTAAGNVFLVDKLVRSTQLDGIDLHVRYVAQTDAGLVLHLSFYNNRGEDLAYVSGADVDAARLVGDSSYEVTEHSPSLDSGIDPDGGWLNGGATVGWLAFGAAQGSAFTLEFPGFPAVELSLDQPVAAPPAETPPPTGSYSYDLEVSSPRLENIALRVEQVRVEEDALLVTVAFVNNNPTDITFTATVNGNDAVLFDNLWRQYRPGQVEQTLDRGIEPAGDVWGEGEANRGTLTFPRPASGDVVLFQFPSYPLVRLPLRADEPATIAAEADLPPSAAPRPTPTPQPTPTPLTGEDLARQQIDALLSGLGEALSGRDREAYLAAFAPELREAQGEIFDRVAELPLEELRVEPTDDSGNGAFEADGGAVSDYQVELSYRVRDVDPENVFTTTPAYSLRRDGDSWQIVEVGGELPFWAYGPTAATRSGAFWIFYRPALADELPAIEQEAQRAFDQVDQALPNRARPVNVMHITATEEEFADLTERSGTQFLGVATARYRIRKAGIQITNQAFYINGAAFQADPSQDRQQTIAHELTHLVLSPQTMPYTPAWISEGAAMYVTRDYPEAVIAPWYREQGPEAISLEELSGKTSFGEHDFTGEQTSLDYAYTAFLARYIVETYGEEQFLALYDSFAAVPYEVISDELPTFGGGSIFNATFGNLAQRLAPEKVEEILGVDLATLEQDYETWLGSVVGSQ